MRRNRKTVYVRPTGEYPCQWDDLVGPDRKVIATIYSTEEGKKGIRKPGIRKGWDGIYDIVTPTMEINNEVVRNALDELSKKTKRNFVRQEEYYHQPAVPASR